jgi:hypothetical protein
MMIPCNVMSLFYQWKLMALKRNHKDLVKISFPSLEPFFTIPLHMGNMMCAVSHLKKNIAPQCEIQGAKMKNFKNILIGVLAAVVVIAVGASAYNALAFSSGPEAGAVTTSGNFGGGNGRGGNGNGGNGGFGTGQVQLTSIPPSDLTAEESAGLLYMREEEKLARDVYNQMFTLWGQKTFQNIASSEQTHMDQVKLLLDRYGLADPALDPGKFTDPALQALYDKLIAQGSVSLEEALKVGALIEQTDINDLQTRLAQTDNADIQLVYNNLMNASYNHLSAFTSGGQQGGRGGGQGSGGRNGQGGGRGWGAHP